MEQELIKIIKKMLPQIADSQTMFSEKDLVPIKAAFLSITNINVPNMMSCGGKLCEDIRRSIVNYMRIYDHVPTVDEPVKTVIPKKVKIKTEKKNGKSLSFREQADKIAKDKDLKKPHWKSTESTLKKFIKDNK